MKFFEIGFLVASLFLALSCGRGLGESADATQTPDLEVRQGEPAATRPVEPEVIVRSPGPVPQNTPTGPAMEADPGVIVQPVPLFSPLPGLLVAAEGCKTYSSPVVRFLVGEDGDVRNVSFVRDTTCESANKKLMEFLQTWRFSPGSCAGISVEAELVLGINLGG